MDDARSVTTHITGGDYGTNVVLINEADYDRKKGHIRVNSLGQRTHDSGAVMSDSDREAAEAEDLKTTKALKAAAEKAEKDAKAADDKAAADAKAAADKAAADAKK